MTLEHQQDCETKVADELGFEEYRLITSPETINNILDRFGINYDDNATLEDSYHAIFTDGDEYWGCHKATPLVSSTVYRIQ